MPSANIIVHGDSFLISSVNLSITNANKKGLRANPSCNPTSTLNPCVVPTTHLTSVALPSPLLHTSLLLPLLAQKPN
ncbi:hypothetical protein LDENG_00177580 [Lucifuga dentata]|nr:hypothetical protein LDENG_00177580 [Lucifuga dentata]